MAILLHPPPPDASPEKFTARRPTPPRAKLTPRPSNFPAWLGASVWLLACNAGPAAHPAPASEPRINVDKYASWAAPNASHAAPAPSPAGAASPLPSAAPRRAGSALLDAEGRVVRVDGDLLFHPKRALPPASIKARLDDVADLMNTAPIQLLRIEVYPSTQRTSDQSRRAAARAQERADAVFMYLWRKRRISAERLEPLGLPGPAPEGEGRRESAGAYVVVLRISQMRPSRDSELEPPLDD